MAVPTLLGEGGAAGGRWTLDRRRGQYTKRLDVVKLAGRPVKAGLSAVSRLLSREGEPKSVTILAHAQSLLGELAVEQARVTDETLGEYVRSLLS